MLYRLPDLLVRRDLLRLKLRLRLRLLRLDREAAGAVLAGGAAVVKDGVGVGAEAGPAGHAPLKAAPVVVARAVPRRGVTCSQAEQKRTCIRTKPRQMNRK